MNTSSVTKYKTKIKEVYPDVEELQDGDIADSKADR